MTTKLPIALIDPCSRTRALFVHLLAQSGKHVEPYEDATGLASLDRFSGVFFTCDTGDLVEQVIATVDPQVNAAGVIAYSDRLDARRMFRAIRAGVIDYMGGPQFDSKQLLEAIHSAELSVLRDAAKRIRKPGHGNLRHTLTLRERQILEFMAAGSTSREIGQTLGISPRTVEIHRANMQLKLRAYNAPHAVRIGLDAGLIT